MRDRLLTGLTIVVLVGCGDAAGNMPAGGLDTGGSKAATGPTGSGAAPGSQTNGSGAVAGGTQSPTGATSGVTTSGGSAAGGATSGSPTGGTPGTLSTGGASGSPEQATGGTPGAGGTTASSGGTGNTTEPGGESTCVRGVQTDDACDPSIDTTSCVRSNRTCECGADATWTCTPTNGQTNTGGSPGTEATGGVSNPGNTGGTGNIGQPTGGTTATGGTATEVITSSCTDPQKTLSSNQTGSHCGYTYEYWKDSGTGSLVLTPDGFSVSWSGINNLLGRKGLRPGSKNQIVTYEANYQPNGNSYLCVYGWTKGPLIEYYIVDSWGSWKPPGGTSAGTVSCDGGTYDIYKTQRVNQPSIEGNTTFYQYWSVRTEKRTSGTITVACHFDAWAAKGMNLGSMYEVSMTVEGYQSSGTADVSMSIR